MSSQDSPSSGSSLARNPISLRLYKVLGTNFNDAAVQQALQTMSELYAMPATDRTDTRQDHHTPKDDDDLLNADSIAPVAKPPANDPIECVPGELAARARKNLRRDMENKLVTSSRLFLQALGTVNEKLDALQTHIDMMRLSCTEAEEHLKSSTEVGATMLERANNLREKRQEVENKKSIVSMFLARFTLNVEEVEALTSYDVPVGKRFFQAMDKTEGVREDCRLLMSGEGEPSRAGLDIMSSTSSYLEQGYEKILRWTLNEFRQMGRESQLDVGVTLIQAVSRLKRRPELLNEALTQLSQTRQATVLSSFLTALTRGGPSGLPRPIELHAHDPIRYIGDMLAWVHQAIATEREFLESLFDVRSDGRMVGSARRFSKEKKTAEEEWISELMDATISKLCGPLKVRVQQTVRSQQSSIISYKIANLLQFYLVTMSHTMGADALLSQTLQDTTDLAYKIFYDAIEAQSHSLEHSTLEADDTSLSPPFVLIDHVQVLREVLTVHQSFIAEEGEGDQGQSNRLQKILDVMVDSATRMSINAAEDKSKIRPVWDSHIFILNCLTYLQDLLEAFPFTKEKQTSVNTLVDERKDMLAEDHYKNLMDDTGLGRIESAYTSCKPSEPLSHLPGAQPFELQACLRQFSSWLSMADAVQSPRLSRLLLQRLNIQIHQTVLERIVQVYKRVCEEVKHPRNKYEAAATLLGSERPFGQVNLLCQILGLEESI